ncbi:helix-turn-helix domain-containing protein [Anaerostipes sp. PC18]|uniref:helix-turn-helix domain-containing protein n=1 Tax=Anaerostipes sp. PC18 TaxID=3036926 RepID=UPI0030881D5D|nr:helix-turn-helix domain-containing protein [Anaerostipes sp. PC18]
MSEIENDKDSLMHYGMPKRSGRYPWGSGKEPYQHSGDFLSRIEELKRDKNLSFIDENGKKWTGETAIAKTMGLSSSEYRIQKALAKGERRAADISEVKRLQDKGCNNSEIARKMGINESSVRSLLDEDSKARMLQSQKTADFLKNQVEKKGMIDVGAGVERELNISRRKLDDALYILERDGYEVHGGRVPQVTNPGKNTTIKVLCPPGTEHKEIYNFDKINYVTDHISHDGGTTFEKGFVYPKSMDSKRLQIRYAEDGGILKDGVIELRRGVPDLSLGESHYSQVRILVDDKKYLKGMAIYSDDMPDGVDVVFNTNKKKGTPKENVLKDISSDPDNPFGSLIKEHGGQSYYYDKNGKKQLSLINKRADEGDWSDWQDKLPSQFLAKQNLDLIKKQLNLAIADKQTEFDEICSLTNPTVKKRLLQSFSDDCDSSAVHLKAAALPRQKHQVILPIKTMKDTEVYAPNYRDGEKVALIRYPHGGLFEIPILTVNNKHPDARNILGTDVKDVVGINSKVAERLSGADFDGDTVMVIPTNHKTKISSAPPLKGLEGFDPKGEYPYSEGMKLMKNPKTGTDNTQQEMGKISNLITDMTIKGASQDELARAVRHSMVVIDAGKHKLDYKRSELENGIKALKRTYQGHYDENGRYHEGASTLISRAKSEVSVAKRQGSPIIDKNTGEVSYKTADDLYYVDKKTGKTKMRTQQSTKMAEVKDARQLSTGHPKEEAYATYANKMKALANEARKEMVTTKEIPYQPSSSLTYKKEVSSLKAKLNVSLMNAPRERHAQAIANAAINAKIKYNPDMTKKEIKKAKQQELTKARNLVGASRNAIDITDKEWEAIQSGAVSKTTLAKILDYTDIDVIRERTTPKDKPVVTPAKANRIAAMRASGYTIAQIADALGISRSTVSNHL